jgi:hypothetical protein
MTQIFLGSARGSRVDLGVLAEINSISVIKDNRAGWTREVRLRYPELLQRRRFAVAALEL